MKRFRSTLLNGGLLLVVTATAAAAEIVLPLDAPVVVLPSTPVTVPVPMAAPTTRPVPLPTTPSGRLPQYQLEPVPHVRIPQPDPQNAGIRFRLIMPHGPLLVEVAVTIEGQPYHTARDRRVKQLLELQAAAETHTESAISAVSLLTAPSEESADLVARLQRYREATGRTLTADEIHWWLTTAVEGPALLWLKDGFQRFRADQRPVFALLDHNRDGVIDADELAAAETSLRAADANRNDIVEFTEVGTATRGKSSPVTPAVLPQISQIDPRESTDVTTPDLYWELDFQSAQPGQSRLRLKTIAATAVTRVESVHAVTSGIALQIDGLPVWFEAVQVAGLTSDQLSIGSVNDGYPWLTGLDLNDDGRLTVRERRQLQQQLAQFDLNGDGRLTAEEAIAPFRIAIALGPTVHRQLANIRSAHPRSPLPADAGPEWFVRMDRNKDHDLIRAEFPGTDEQFRTMDRNADQLIDVTEARMNDSSQSLPKTSDPPVATQPPTP